MRRILFLLMVIMGAPALTILDGKHGDQIVCDGKTPALHSFYYLRPSHFTGNIPIENAESLEDCSRRCLNVTACGGVYYIMGRCYSLDYVSGTRLNRFQPGLMMLKVRMGLLSVCLW
uniref:Apple domain-containing protein n=1 Tax=Caenorhabditis japonica TaxID=281687 RepID=A0A8R1EFV2_CAEJA